MARQWMRTIDSAQRHVRVTSEQAHLPEHVTEVIFQIQGVHAHEMGRQLAFPFTDMYERGVNVKGVKPLGFWDRIFRREAPTGQLTFEPERVTMTLWSDPELVLGFDLTDEAQADLFRECEIMALSAGYHFLSEGERQGAYKVNALDPIE